MAAFKMPTIQVAGILDEDEARLVAECGVDLLAFPLDPIRGEAEITAEAARRIVEALRPPARGVLITYLASAGAILSRSGDIGVSIVQLHGEVPIEELVKLRRAASGILVVKTLVVRGDNLTELVDDIDRLSPHADAFLLDTFDPETGCWGATGKTHDWSVSRRLVGHSARPVILAGGLTPENVRRAILEVGPAGVDVHTGVEDSRGRKDHRRVESFIAEARRAFASLA